MNEKNLDYLQNLLNDMGFGKKLNEMLENAISKELPKFSLGITSMSRPLEKSDSNAPRTDHLAFTLFFNRSSSSDMYFLNDYTVTLNQREKNLVHSHSFNLERDYRISAYQAHKLLSGMSLEKEVYLKSKNEEQHQGKPQEKTALWFKLNLDVTDAYGNHPLKTFRPEYGYDLKNTLEKYPIKDIHKDDNLKHAMNTLKNGKYLQAVMTVDNKKIPVNIAANPQMKTLDIYDKNMVEIRNERIFPQQEIEKNTKDENKNLGERMPEHLPWKQEPEISNNTAENKGR